MRELHRQILPAMTASALLVGEGPHDSAAYGALAERLDLEQGVLPPEAFGIPRVNLLVFRLRLRYTNERSE
jgi:hypothetical protein